MKGLNKDDPSLALAVAGLRLCGAYDVLGKGGRKKVIFSN